jgi:hypothetical protein
MQSQLAAEQGWLRGETPRSFLAPRYNPSPQQIDAAKQAEKVLARRELASVLRMLEQHNRQRVLERHKTQFLLAPYLFHVISSVELRKSVHDQHPLLAKSPRKVHAHFRKVAAKTRDLARLIRKGPQPLIAPGMPLDRLLNDVFAVAFTLLAEKTPPQRRQKQQSELRHRAIIVFDGAFRNEWKQPHNEHVADIVTALTGIPTDADYVKKVVKRWKTR